MPSDESSSPEPAALAETFAEHCIAVNAARLKVIAKIALGLSLVATPTEYLLLSSRPDVASWQLWWMLSITGVCMLGTAIFLLSDLAWRNADVMCALCTATSMGIAGAGLSHIGGFETLYTGIAIVVPMTGAIFLMPLWRRLWTTALAPTAFFATFFVMRPGAVDYPYVGVPLFHSALVVALATTFGELTYRLAREHHAQRGRLAGEASRLDAAVRVRTAEVFELARNLVSLEETNRTRIARELHDELGQALTAARLEAGAVAADIGSRVGRDDEATRRAAGIEARIALAQQTVKEVVFALRPPALDDYDLATALRVLVDGCRQSSGLEIAYDNRLDGAALTETQATTVFRVLQEGLTNVVRHAHATRATVHVTVDDGHLVLVLADDGRGLAAGGSRVGFGLRGMRERLRLVAGDLSLGADDGGGTVLRAWFPIGGARRVAAHVEKSRHES